MFRPKFRNLIRAACCAAMMVVLLSAPVAAAQSAEDASVRTEAESGDSRPATLGDLRHLENSLRTELREIQETIRWLIIALVAVLGLPQLSAWWDRNRGGGGGGGNGKGASAAVSFALAAAPWALGAFAIVAAIAG